MAEILKPETNIPYEVAMKYAAPKIVPSNFDSNQKQALITLVDGRIVYAPAFVADRLAELGIGANDPFVIMRREVRENGTKGVRWEVTPKAKAAAVPASVPPPPVVPPVPVAAPAPDPEPARISPRAACMCAAICAAVDAVLEGQTYAQRKGLGLNFSEESIRAIALTIYIDTCRKEGAR